jgi:hypothetical protein
MVKVVSLMIVASFFAMTAASAQSPFVLRFSLQSGVKFNTTSYGVFGVSPAVVNTPGFFYPRMSNIGYMCGSGLWFGTRKRRGDSLVDLTFITFDPNTGQSWASPGEWRADDSVRPVEQTYIGYSPDYDRATGVWLPWTRSLGWPLWSDGRSPVKLSNPGTVVSNAADRDTAISGIPAFVPGVTEQFVSRYHDGSLARYQDAEADGHPIGLQIEQNVYAFDESAFGNVVILHYRIINVSDDTLFDCHVGQMIDVELGSSANDHACFYAPRIELGTAYVFSDTTYSDGRKHGTLLQTLLETPAVERSRESSRFNFIRHDRMEYALVEEIGATTFQRWSPTYTDTDPPTHADRYNFMAARERDTDERQRNVATLLATGPFNMLPGDTARYVIALTVLPDLKQPPGGVIPEIEEAAENVLALYRGTMVSRVRHGRGDAEAFSIGAVLPNPATGRATVALRLPHRATARIELVDMLGRVVLTRESGMLESGERTIGIDFAGIAPGVYLLSVESEGIARSTRVVVGE